MRVRVYFSTGFAASALMLMSSIAIAQATQTTETKKPSAATAVVAASNGQPNSIAWAHQDQFGHASGVAADAPAEQPTTPAEAKKHLAGVKYEDRATAPNGAQTGKLDAKGTQEKHTRSVAVGAVNPHQ